MATIQLPPGTSQIDATYPNLSTAELYEHAVRNGEGVISAHGLSLIHI